MTAMEQAEAYCTGTDTSTPLENLSDIQSLYEEYQLLDIVPPEDLDSDAMILYQQLIN